MPRVCERRVGVGAIWNRSMPTSSEIRKQFIDYFVGRHDHCNVPSSPVVPHDDPTLLFANAGMNQFKDVFLGTGTRQYSRATNTQKCIRAGGKHNDLEDVGKDTYHHTFFEMLGNWSFGDYFKKEAIGWAWDLLTNVWGLDKSLLHVTVFEGDKAEGLEPDDEAQSLWKTQTDIDPTHIHKGNRKDNFWEMGDVGPCGPCSEIHVDLTDGKIGGKLVNAGDPRVMEIWNLVFIQFNRDASGKLSPLPARHVDTGMGFERICAVLQGKASNYDTDVFTPIFEAISQVTGAAPYGGILDDSPQGKVDMAYRVIADHIRCLTFALTDGALPSNEGRGYVLRRILRRAVRHGWQTLGVKEPFLHRLVIAVVDAMGGVFPELTKDAQRIADVIKDEEESFGRTLERGIYISEKSASDAVGRAYGKIRNLLYGGIGAYAVWEGEDERPAQNKAIQELGFINRETNEHFTVSLREAAKFVAEQREEPIQIRGEDAFKLHDTFGFPLDLTQVMAQERGMTVDVVGFDRLMEEARQKARAGGGAGRSATASLVDIVQQDTPPATDFLGDNQAQNDVDTFCLLCQATDSSYQRVATASAGDELAMVVGHSTFYAEAGGQVGDTGTIETKQGGVFRVRDTVKVGSVHFHLGVVEAGQFREQPPTEMDAGFELILKVDRVRRAKIMANHTGTHLMNRALREILGEHVEQKGSLVDDQKLRFDFSHNAVVTHDQIDQIEQRVNADITADLNVYAQEADQEEALKINGLRAVFGEKYPPRVRVVSIGAPVDELLGNPGNDSWCGLSIEFCGGTHLAKTGDAEGFVVANEEAVAKGVRRLTAMTGQTAHRAAARSEMLQLRLAELKSAFPDDLPVAIADLTAQMEGQALPLLAKTTLRQGIAKLQEVVKSHAKQRDKQAAGVAVEQARALAQSVQGDVMVAPLEGADGGALRTAMDVIRKKNPGTALLLGGVSGGKVAFVASVPKGLIAKGLKAGDWVRQVAKAAGGGGGGRPDMAQAGGKDPAKLEAALQVGREFAAEVLSITTSTSSDG